MVLTEFVYDPNGKSNSTLFNLTKGTFTFVAGNVAEDWSDMKVDTPVATMGIRGTTPHVEISDDGTVKFSTLIEEARTNSRKSPGHQAAQQPEQNLQPKLNLNLCQRVLEHDPKKQVLSSPRDKREAFARRSCSDKEIEPMTIQRKVFSL